MDATVNLMTGEARVLFDPVLISLPQLVTAVEDVGYDAAPAPRNRPLAATFDTRDEMGATGTRDARAAGGRAVALRDPAPGLALPDMNSLVAVGTGAAFLFSVVAIPVATGVLYPAFGILLSPTLASAAMALSSVSVVANSLRLRRVNVGAF